MAIQGSGARAARRQVHLVHVDERHEAVLADLRDGGKALLRPLRPGDRWRLAEGLQRLSPRSRYLRFHAPVNRLTEAQLDHLTAVDGHDHVAWVALDPDDPEGLGWGVGRFIRLPDEPEVAEAAITVLDEQQNRGIGTALLAHLEESARAVGIMTFRSYVLADNLAMLHVFDEIGATPHIDAPGVVRVEVALGGDQPTRARRVLREAGRRQGLLFAVLDRVWRRGSREDED